MRTEFRPRIYLRKLDHFGWMMTWLWMGTNPVGEDWILGSVGLFTLERAIKSYCRKLRRAGHGVEIQ